MASAWLHDHPADDAFRFALAEEATQRKDYATAIRYYQQALQNAPDNAVLLNNLAWVAGQAKDPHALEYAERANKIAPDQPRNTRHAGGVAGRQGRDQARCRHAAPRGGRLRRGCRRSASISRARSSRRGRPRPRRRSSTRWRASATSSANRTKWHDCGRGFEWHRQVRRVTCRDDGQRSAGAASAGNREPRPSSRRRPSPSSAWAMWACRWRSSSARSCRRSASTCRRRKVESYRAVRRSDRRGEPRRARGGAPARGRPPTRRRCARPISSSSPCRRRSTIAHQPDFGPLIGASESVGRNLKRGAIVVFESTVYPGRHRGGLRSGPREALGPAVEAATSSSATRPSASTRATRSTR